MNGVDENALAAQVEAMKDDAEAWGDPEPDRPRKSERRQRSAMVSVRFTEDELARVQAHAAQRGSSVAGYLRNVALASASKPVIIEWSKVVAVNGPQTPEELLTRNEQGIFVTS